MIEKLKPEIKELFGAECPIYNSQALLDTVNQLVDAVNELQATISKMEKVETRAENVQPDAESRPENVQDKFAEQRKWIGKLCRFWDFVYDHYYFDTLKGITDKGLFIGHNGSWEHCEPVKPDSEIIYHGE